MLDAKHELRRLLRSHRQGSHAVQEARRDTVQAFVKALDENGFSRAVRQSGFKIKEAHVRRAVGVWRASGTAGSTIEKRLGHLRFMARAQGRPGVMRENKAYLPGYKRERQARETKAIDPARVDPDKCRSTYAAASVSLQKEFGVRRKEAILVQPWRSERKDGRPATHLVLHGDCTKGGRPRSIPIRTEAQRSAYERALATAGSGSLCPPGRTYGGEGGWKHEYRREAERAGVPNGSTHALRAAYAERRYQEEAGQEAPTAGGPRRADMDGEARQADGMARDVVSAELGHGRRSVVAQYIGGAKAPEPVEGDDE